MSVLVLVDGPNFYNDVGRYLSETQPSRAPETVQAAYYREWFDVDRFIAATLPQNLTIDPLRGLGTVIVHSRKNLGLPKSNYYLHGEQVMTFWGRQGSGENTSTLLVEIPGSRGGAEKGIDTSVVVYMFETLKQWDTAVLFSNDTDFVPAIWSLRRMGKRVHCSSHVADLDAPLVLACQHFFPWSLDFLQADRDLFEFLWPGGTLDEFLSKPDVQRLNPRVRFNRVNMQVSFHPQERTDQHNITYTTDSYRDRLNHSLRGIRIHAMSLGSVITFQTRSDGESTDGNRALTCGSEVFGGIRRSRPCLASAHWHSILER